MQTANGAAQNYATVYEAVHSESLSDSGPRMTCVINCDSSGDRAHQHLTSDLKFGQRKSGPLTT